MHIFDKGQAVAILDSKLTGIITDIAGDGQITVSLDVGGELVVTADKLSLVEDRLPANTGRFQEGHPYHGPNPQYEALKADAKDIKQNMLNQLAPLFNNIGTYIRQIPSASKKIDALAKMAPYVLPALSRVEFTDETPRNLTEEQRLEEFIKQKQERENKNG